MTLVAHRGFAGIYPENTLFAFRRAARRADGVELDVRACASGEAVVLHDETVDRVTDGTGRVADLSLADLRELTVLDSGEAPPTLREAFEAVPDDCTLHVELKEATVAPAVESLADEFPHEVVVSSFDPDALCRVSLPRALLFAEDRTANMERARALDCAFVHPHASLVDGAFVGRAHDAGLGVNVWTVGGDGEWSVPVERASALRAVGVDGLIADVPV